MTRIANRFTDPVGGGHSDWPVNHNEESVVAKSRQMGSGASTDNIGLVAQQGPAAPLTFEWKGSFFDPAQLTMFLAWWELCEEQTIYLTDIAGDEYEILITDFQPERKAAARNPKFPELTYTWEYTITFRIVTAISGPWAGVTP